MHLKSRERTEFCLVFYASNPQQVAHPTKGSKRIRSSDEDIVPNVTSIINGVHLRT